MSNILSKIAKQKKIKYFLICFVDLFGVSTELNSTHPTTPITISNITFDKWINVILGAQGKTFDLFVYGVLIHREIFSDVIKQNYGDVFIAHQLGNGSTGFSGKISNLWYFDKALGTTEIVNIVNG